MMEKLAHLLTGYTCVELEGDSARFLNLAARSGFHFWQYRRRGKRFRVCCRAREYRRLRPLARRCRVRMRCVEKRGLPFQTRRLWRKKGLLLGMAAGAAIFWLLSGCVWGVSVTGAETLGDGVILEAARAGGLYSGVRKKDFDPGLTSRRIIGALPRLKWTAVNTDGCFAEIKVGEAREKPPITDDGVWSNIVALQPGTVVEISAQRGRPEVALGDTMEPGDLLISGLYVEQLDPWDIHYDRPLETLGAARGSVIAETYRVFTVQASQSRTILRETGQRRVHRTLCIFGLRIPLGLQAEPRGQHTFFRRVRTLKALGVSLPCRLEETVYRFTEAETLRLGEEQLKNAALLRLREAQKAMLPPGAEVTAEELTWAFPEGCCILHAACRCREEIGQVKEIERREEKLGKMPEKNENF